MTAPSRVDDRYAVEERLGEGGMGVVYKAYDLESQAFVALKIMKEGADTASLDLFAREWKALRNIGHPAIVEVVNSGEFQEDGCRRPYIVMPLLPGRTLDGLIREASHRLTVERVVDILIQTCHGLQVVHDHNLIHRDVKPSNIFVMDDDSVKIVDFGMGRLSDTGTTGTRAAGVGTLQYMAPEQLEKKEVTAATDIFSLGVVAYEALTGVKPFDRGTESATSQAIRNEFPTPASELNPAVNKGVGQVVAKAMAKGPRHRFSSAREFAESLQTALKDEGAELFVAAGIQPRVARAQRALREGDFEFANEILNDLQLESPGDSEIGRLLEEVKQAASNKALRGLLDSARLRLEEEEYALAWQKVREALRRDPGNAEAQALLAEIETRHSEEQSERLRSLVQQHFHNHAFTQARQAIEEIRKIRRDDLEVTELMAEADRLENEFRQACEEKEKLYQSAMRAYNNGEIGTALSKLVKILGLDSRTPGLIAPGRDEVYRETYIRIRTELEAAQHAIAEIEEVVATGNLAGAVEMSRQQSERYPYDFGLQALKLKVEDQLRQEKSAYIAETGRRVEAEPDLDCKLRLLEAALLRYPKEPHLRELSSSLRKRLDLVESMAVRARQYEEQNLLGEAAGQWSSLRSIYPLYPGIDFEIQRAQFRLEQQKRDEAKLTFVDRVDRLLETSDYEGAHAVAVEALAEFSGDEELLNLKQRAMEGRERSVEAQKLTQQSQGLRAERRIAEAIELLRRAAGLDPHDPGILNELASALAGQAQALVTNDWRAADPLIQEALRIAPANALAKNLRRSVLLAKRMEFVDRCLSQARELQVAGDTSGALTAVQEGLAAYPHDNRLVELQNALRSTVAHEAYMRRRRNLEERRPRPAKDEGVREDTVVTELMETGSGGSNPVAGNTDVPTVVADVHTRAGGEPKQPSIEVPPDPGLYRSMEDGCAQIELKMLSGVKGGASLGKLRIRRSRAVGYLVGPASQNRFAHPAPVFYLRLREGQTFEEIVLVALEAKGDRREIEMGSGEKEEFKAEAVRQFDSFQTGPRLFRIDLLKLDQGEYMFFLSGSAERHKNNYGKGYDFGIDEPLR